MEDQPIAPFADGRDPTTGRFLPGNPGGNGNPHSRKTAQLREAMLSTVTENDVREIVGRLIDKAKAGDVDAVRELFNRLFGKSDAKHLLSVAFDPVAYFEEMPANIRNQRLAELFRHFQGSQARSTVAALQQKYNVPPVLTGPTDTELSE